MKNTIFLLISFSLNLSLNAQTHYQEILRFKNNEIQAVITYNANDILDGESIYYYPNGYVKSYINYIEGKANGTIENYHQNGELEAIGLIVDDKAEGIHEYYHSNGVLKQLILYKNNRIIDINKCTDKKNNKLYCGKVKNGNGFINIYDEKGNLIARDQIENGLFTNRINLNESNK
jgi:antitoxin component YwqK of YwqJK toxin-antitoxin module